MTNWGSVPEWLTAAVAVISLKYLIEYAHSAEEQVAVTFRQAKEAQRPVLVVTSLEVWDRGKTRKFYVENQGLGIALGVEWQANGFPQHLLQGSSKSRVLGPKSGFEAEFTAPLDTKLFFVYHSNFGEKLLTEVLITDDLFTNRYYPNEGSRSEIIA